MPDDHETARGPQDFEVRGSLSIDGRRGVLRYEVVIPKLASAVWSALTDPERLAAWYGHVEGELLVGGRYHAVLFPSGWEGDGTVLSCEPERKFRIESGEPGEPATVDDLELIPEGSSSTRLILTRSRPSADMLDAYAVGTQLHLENLIAHLAGNEPIDPEPLWAALHPLYTALAAATARDIAG